MARTPSILRLTALAILAMPGASCTGVPREDRAMSRWAERGIARTGTMVQRITDLFEVDARAARFRSRLGDVAGRMDLRGDRLIRSTRRSLGSLSDEVAQRPLILVDEADALVTRAQDDVSTIMRIQTVPWTQRPLGDEITSRIDDALDISEVVRLDRRPIHDPSDPERYTGADDPPPQLSIFNRILKRIPL